jgi:hypothetical protein
MTTEPKTTKIPAQKERAISDKTPQGDLRKMLDLGANARSKFIKAKDEKSGTQVLEIMGRIELMLLPAPKADGKAGKE